MYELFSNVKWLLSTVDSNGLLNEWCTTVDSNV